jgi:murein DD-endopeptidase MepM/ murein hydrolase activator NlpD
MNQKNYMPSRKNMNPLIGLKKHITCIFQPRKSSSNLQSHRLNSFQYSSLHSSRPFKIKGYDFKVEYGLHLKPLKPRLTEHWFSKGLVITSPLVMLALLWWLNSSSASISSPPSAKISFLPQPSTFTMRTVDAKTTSTVPTDKMLDPTSISSAIKEINLSESSKNSSLSWLHLKIKPGDSFSRIFRKHQLNQTQLHQMLGLPESAKPLRQLQINQEVHIKHDPDGQVEELLLMLKNNKELYIFKRENGLYDSEIRKIGAYTEERISVHGQIETELAIAIRELGLSEDKLSQLNQIFKGEIDFDKGIKPGDQFTMIYKQRRFKEEIIEEGHILAAEFVNKDHVYRAFHYTDPTGYTDYYTSDGYHVHQFSLFRAPLEEYNRISSPFGDRKHPILRKYRFHTGTDYAAPSGTPVFAAGDATVQFVDRRGGYGKTIILEHSLQITTLYAHLSNFEELSVGDEVIQGQIIAYVGQTGRATGPHLHYEIRVDGKHQDPQEIELPLSIPMAEKYKTRFISKTRKLITQLDKMNQLAPTRMVETTRTPSISTVAKSTTIKSALEQHSIQ